MIGKIRTCRLVTLSNCTIVHLCRTVFYPGRLCMFRLDVNRLVTRCVRTPPVLPMKLVYVPSLQSVLLYGLVKCGLLVSVEWTVLSELDSGTVPTMAVARPRVLRAWVAPTLWLRTCLVHRMLILKNVRGRKIRSSFPMTLIASTRLV